MDLLRCLLRPAGAGIHTVSTGKREQEALAQALYGVANPSQVQAAWEASLAQIAGATGVVLGIPSDVGAGLVRGAAYGPQGLRQAWLARDCQGPRGFAGLIDVGDVRVVPQLLSDHMLSETQLHATRAALYPDLSAAEAARLPVSPLSIAEAALDHMFSVNPDLKVLMLGGDHSVAWPVVAALGKKMHEPWAIVHFDAHTDLLETRLGIDYCFATWAFHARKVLGKGSRLVQVGIRASGRDRAHWESTLGVRQFWAAEVAQQPVAATVEQIVAHLRGEGVQHVYISNDIDGTDGQLAPATGTPEPQGLAPELVLAVISALGQQFNVIGADLVEVAPPVGNAAGARATCDLGVSYLLASAAAML
ncbi:MAG: arginase family protein [Deltaproteobacteria bacterium]|nr:arginase family protein [Deltaproteobacteria bacterium]